MEHGECQCCSKVDAPELYSHDALSNGADLKDNDESGWRNELVIGSDLLEACSDWGQTINLERSLRETKSVLTSDAKKMITLTSVQKATVLRVNHSAVNMPIQAEHLRNLWHEALTTVGAQSVRVIEGPTALTNDDEETPQP